ncbi:hypothetical protein [Streptomyces sp. NPDC017991]|uniref:hypothetical protein n=1 Tax=Streptomyces sp. NPDC017991 TaxID=3365026 RepID=UPI0037A1B5FD
MTHRPKASVPLPSPTTTRDSRARTAHDGIRRTAGTPARPTGRTSHAARPTHPVRPARPAHPAEGRARTVAGVPGGLARHAYAYARGDRP